MGKKHIPGTPAEQLYAAGQMVQDGTIKTFKDLLQYVYHYVLAEAMEIKKGAFTRRLANLEKFELNHFFKLERRMGLEPGTLLQMIAREREAKDREDLPGGRQQE